MNRMLRPCLNTLAFAIATGTMAQSGLVMHYPLDGDATEAVGGVDGTVMGGTPTADRFGNPAGAMHFDGVDDHVLLDSIPIADLDSMTISVWVRPLTIPDMGIAVNYGFDDCVTGTGIAMGIGSGVPGYTPGDHVQFLHCGWNFFDGMATYTDTLTWMNLVVVRLNNASNLYVNGVLQWSFGGNYNTPTAPWNIGSASGCRFFHGDVDDLRIFQEPLDQTGIDSLVTGLQQPVVMRPFGLSPVPALDQLRVHHPAAATLRFEVLDAQGRTMLVQRGPVLDVAALRPGLYLLRAIGADATVAVPWVKE